MITEKDLIRLGFAVVEFENDDEIDYYYILDVIECITLISSTNTESKRGKWTVEIKEDDESEVLFNKLETLEMFITSLEKARKKGVK